MELKIEDLIRKTWVKWMDCDKLPEESLLRLSLLRELLKGIHAEKSRCLATGLKSEVSLLKQMELGVESLREEAQFPNDLQSLMQNPESVKKKNRFLPEGLFKVVEREKLNRYDRKWEAVIAAEGLSLGWGVWSLEAWVNISQIEEWDRTLAEKLWPHGVVLFTESAQSEAMNLQSDNPKETLWLGRWMLLLHPRFRSEKEFPNDLKKWPGAPDVPPVAPNWNQIYPDS